MITVTGVKTNFGYRMQSPIFPYNSILYVGYSLSNMKKKYREDFNLAGKRLDWIILESH